MPRIQAASCGRPFVRSPGPLLRAISTDTATVRCAIPGSASISGSETRASKRSAMRSLRALRATPGAARAYSRRQLLANAAIAASRVAS
jgi:hypothetical protein